MSKTDSPIKPGALVRVEDLRKVYRLGRVRLEVLKKVSFSVREGEFLGIYGHSGSGKSTLLHVLGLLDSPTEGTVELAGADIASLPAAERNRMRCEDIGFVFQFYHLLPELNVLENAVLPAMVGSSTFGWFGRRRDVRQRAAALLDELGLGDRMKHRPNELSGGERQRVAIARALVNGPKLLLADEPTGNLDSRTGEKIMNLLLRYNRDHGQTILMVTHDRDLAGLVTRCLELEDGRLNA
jgi:lipoprotein-releasing system ATP-binding protein